MRPDGLDRVKRDRFWIRVRLSNCLDVDVVARRSDKHPNIFQRVPDVPSPHRKSVALLPEDFHFLSRNLINGQVSHDFGKPHRTVNRIAAEVFFGNVILRVRNKIHWSFSSVLSRVRSPERSLHCITATCPTYPKSQAKTLNFILSRVFTRARLRGV